MLDWSGWETIAGALVAIGSACGIGAKIGAGRQNATPDVPETGRAACAAKFESVAGRHEHQHAETRQLILEVKEGDRLLLRELRDGFMAELRELRALEGRQNELMASAVGEMRSAMAIFQRFAPRDGP